MQERRAFPRWSIALDCEAKGSADNFPAAIRGLSENGLRLVSGQQLAPGDELNVSWQFGSDPSPFVVRCVVRNTEDGKAGVEFLNLTLGDRLRIVQQFHSLDGKNRSS